MKFTSTLLVCTALSFESTVQAASMWTKISKSLGSDNRRFSFDCHKTGWHGLGATLNGSPAYTIKLFKRSRSDRLLTHPSFSITPDTFSYSGKKKALIQTFPDSYPSKNLCILTTFDNKIDYGETESFTKAMIKSKQEDRSELFASYKFNKLSDNEYNIYAWVTEADCAFYNLGMPVAYTFPNQLGTSSIVKRSVLTGSTEVAFHLGSKEHNYGVQITKTRIGEDTAYLMFVNKYGKREAPKLHLVDSAYSSVKELAEKSKESGFVNLADSHILTKGPEAEGIDKEASRKLREDLQTYLKQGIFSIRIQAFPEDKYYEWLFDQFPSGTTSIVSVRYVKNKVDEENKSFKEVSIKAVFDVADSDDDTSADEDVCEVTQEDLKFAQEHFWTRTSIKNVDDSDDDSNYDSDE